MSDVVAEALLARKDEILDRLLALLRMPSVSTDPAYAAGMKATREFLMARLKEGGLEDVRLLDGGGHPAVTGAWNMAVQTTDPRLGLSSGAFRFPLVLSQTGAQVIGTVTDPALVLGRQGLGNASNPRQLSLVGLELGPTGSTTRVTFSFVGELNSDLRTWTGTATGFADCPCPFTATR